MDTEIVSPTESETGKSQHKEGKDKTNVPEFLLLNGLGMAECTTEREGYPTGSVKVFVPKTSKNHVPDLRCNVEFTISGL